MMTQAIARLCPGIGAPTRCGRRSEPFCAAVPRHRAPTRCGRRSYLSGNAVARQATRTKATSLLLAAFGSLLGSSPTAPHHRRTLVHDRRRFSRPSMVARAVLLPALSPSSGRRPRYRGLPRCRGAAPETRNVCQRSLKNHELPRPRRNPQMQGAPEADTTVSSATKFADMVCTSGV
jgi:hypothetical protein